MTDNTWSQVLERLRTLIQPEEYRRWFSASAQATDSGDQLTIWIPSAADGRHISVHYLDVIARELDALGRHGVAIRFVPTGYGEDDEDDDLDA